MRGWWALETGSQTVYGVSLIASCSFIKIYSINMWCALCYAIGLPFPQLVSDQKKPLVLTLPFPLLDTLDCPDLHRPVNKYCAQKSMKDLSTELYISLFFLVFFAFFMNTRYNHRNKEQTLKAVRSHRPLCQFPFLPPFLVWCVTFWGVNNLYTGSGLA